MCNQNTRGTQEEEDNDNESVKSADLFFKMSNALSNSALVM